MTTIYAYETMLCPADRVGAFVADYLAGLGGGDGRAQLPVRVQVGDIVIEADVEAELSARPGILGYQLFDLRLKPANEAVYPSFAGTLSAADEGGGFCRIDLDGSYAPPLGPLGAAFDAALGRRIAEATLRDLLQRFKFHCEAANRAHPVPAP